MIGRQAVSSQVAKQGKELGASEPSCVFGAPVVEKSIKENVPGKISSLSPMVVILLHYLKLGKSN